MALKRCSLCGGSGKVMGGGMMMHDCDDCDGSGKIKIIDDVIGYLEIKNTDSYKSAIEQIKASDSSISNDEAEKIFEEEFNKIDVISKPKKGLRK